MTRTLTRSGSPGSTEVDIRLLDPGSRGPSPARGDYWPGPLRRRLAVLLGLPRPGSR